MQGGATYLMVLVVNFRTFEVIMFCVVVRPSAWCGDYTWPMLSANSICWSLLEIWVILEISSQIWVMPVQFEVSQTSVSQQSLRKGFKNVVSRWDRPCIACTSCTRSHFATTRQNHLISKIRKKTMATKTILRCTPCFKTVDWFNIGACSYQANRWRCLFVCLLFFVVVVFSSFFLKSKIKVPHDNRLVGNQKRWVFSWRGAHKYLWRTDEITL